MAMPDHPSSIWGRGIIAKCVFWKKAEFLKGASAAGAATALPDSEDLWTRHVAEFARIQVDNATTD